MSSKRVYLLTSVMIFPGIYYCFFCKLFRPRRCIFKCG